MHYDMHGMEEYRPWSTSNYYTFRTVRLQKASKNMYLDIRCPGRDSSDTLVLKAQFLTKHAGFASSDMTMNCW